MFCKSSKTQVVVLSFITIFNIFIHSTSACAKTVVFTEDFCAHDFQCREGKLGRLSLCNKAASKCQCFDVDSRGREEMVLADGKCHRKKSIGDSCKFDIECNKTIVGDAYCNKVSGKCRCREGSRPDEKLSSCVPGSVAERFGSNCKNNYECQQGGLGRYSECSKGNYCKCSFGAILNEIRNTCEIQEFEGNYSCRRSDECRFKLKSDFVECVNFECMRLPNNLGDKCASSEHCQRGALGLLSRCIDGECQCYAANQDTKYHEESRRCILKKQYNQSCVTGSECKLSLGEDNADCLDLKCLPLARKYNDWCVNTEQCRKGALGNLSSCIGGKCECLDSGIDKETSYHPERHKCYLRRQYNDSCSENEECEASLGLKVICGYVNDQIESKVCFCPSGKVCRSSYSSSYVSSGSFSFKFINVCLFRNILFLMSILFICSRLVL